MTLGKISMLHCRDMRHCHFLNSTRDIGDPTSRAPISPLGRSRNDGVGGMCWGGGGMEKTMALRNASGQVGIHTYPLTTNKGVVASVAELLMHVFMSLAACKPRHIRALPAQEPEAGLVFEGSTCDHEHPGGQAIRELQEGGEIKPCSRDDRGSHGTH